MSEDAEENSELALAEVHSIWQFLFPYLRPSLHLVATLGGIVLLEGAFQAAFSISLKYLIDDGFLRKDVRLLLYVIVSLAAAGLLVSLAGLLGDYLQAKIAAQVVAGIRARLFDHLQILTPGFFNRSSSGAILSRFSGDALAIEHALSTSVPWCFLPLAEALFSVVILFTFSVKLSVAALLILPLTIIGPKLFAGQAFATGFQKRVMEGAVLSSAQEAVQAHLLIKAYNLEPWSANWFRGANAKLSLTQRRFLFRSALVERSASVSTLLMHVIIVSFGAFLTFRGAMSIGTLVAFESIFLSLCYAVTYVTQYVGTAAQAAGAVRHLSELFDEQTEIQDSLNAIALPGFHRDIVFADVSFSYTRDRPVLGNISFRIPKNSFAAFVGNSGSGKTTILTLLQRFYDPDSGTVMIDGHDLRSLKLQEFRRHIGIVFQDSFLFNLSIRENIGFGDLAATQAEIEAAAKAAEIHDFIIGLPQGYESAAGERGVQLSGGQRQRIAIARAILRNPEILLLDEATSALDAPTEAAIGRTLMKLKAGRTVMAVTHRLPLVVDADEIFVLHEGQLVESGTHQGLLRQAGVYRELWLGQHHNSLNMTSAST